MSGIDHTVKCGVVVKCQRKQVDQFRFMEENERVITTGGRPATAPVQQPSDEDLELDRETCRAVVRFTVSCPFFF